MLAAALEGSVARTQRERAMTRGQSGALFLLRTSTFTPCAVSRRTSTVRLRRSKAEWRSRVEIGAFRHLESTPLTLKSKALTYVIFPFLRCPVFDRRERFGRIRTDRMAALDRDVQPRELDRYNNEFIALRAYDLERILR
jgi:hypothetical protein